MKKLFLMAIVAMFTMSASAQSLTSNRTSNNVWFDLAVGSFCGTGVDGDYTGLGLDVGFRWNKMFNEYVGWDIVKVAAQMDTKHIDKSLCGRALTGIRGESPVLFSNVKAYANFAGGYIYNIDRTDGSLAWEVGFGLKLFSRFNVGVDYDWYTKNGDTTGFVNLKLGVAF